MGKATILHWGPWQVPYKAVNVLCSDGRRRNVRLHSEADTYFSIPGSVKVKGKTVTGYVAYADQGEDIAFHAYQNRCNGHLLP